MAHRKRASDNPEDAPEPETLDPYCALAAAFLQRVVWDAKGKLITGGGVRDIHNVQYQARLFLEDEAAMEWWIEITGCNSDMVLPALRRALV